MNKEKAQEIFDAAERLRMLLQGEDQVPLMVWSKLKVYNLRRKLLDFQIDLDNCFNLEEKPTPEPPCPTLTTTSST